MKLADSNEKIQYNKRNFRDTDTNKEEYQGVRIKSIMRNLKGGVKMNKPLVAVSFIILILTGFMFSYLLKVTGNVFLSYLLLFFYYLSLLFIIVQFIEKPKQD